MGFGGGGGWTDHISYKQFYNLKFSTGLSSFDRNHAITKVALSTEWSTFTTISSFSLVSLLVMLEKEIFGACEARECFKVI